MSKCINNFLCYENFVTSWAVLAFCKTCCCTCRCNGIKSFNKVDYCIFKAFIISPNPYIVPFFFRSNVVNFCERITIGKCAIIDIVHTMGECYTCKSIVIESIFSNITQLAVFADGHACQACTSIEGVFVNTCHTIRNNYACQTGTTTEGINANGCQLAIFAKSHVCQVYTIIEGIPANLCHSVGYGNACKVIAPSKCFRANGCQLTIFAKSHGYQIVTFCKSALSNRSHAVRYNHIFKILTI